MARYIIKGGANLQGEIMVRGAKNAVLPLLTATLLAEGEYILSNVPHLSDVETMIKLVEHLGLQVKEIGDHEYQIINSGIKTVEAPYELVKAMRASFLVMGPLLGKMKQAKVPMPGGCAIGTRPVNFHLAGFESLGVKINIDHGFVDAKAEELVGAEINLPFPTVTGTENLIMAAVLAKGKTIINNAAREPEITDLCEMLNKMGAKISGLETACLTIEGVEKLHACEHTVVPDRIEAGTLMIMSALAKGQVKVKGANLKHLGALVQVFKQMNIDCGAEADGTIFVGPNSSFKGTNISTEPYPGFATDLQPQLMVLMCAADVSSTIEEKIFENRFMHVQELNRLGAGITTEERRAFIPGNKKLVGAEVSATDLRAGVSLVLAALFAENTTTVNEIFHIERGYENLVERLKKLGANIERVE